MKLWEVFRLSFEYLAYLSYGHMTLRWIENSKAFAYLHAIDNKIRKFTVQEQREQTCKQIWWCREKLTEQWQCR